MNTKRGMTSSTTIGIVALVVLVAGSAGVWYVNSASDDDAMMREDKAMMEDDSMTQDDAMMADEDEAMMESGTETSFRSAVIAGSSSPLLEFDQRDYQTALDSGKLVVLYFYANWCPTCRDEFPKMEAAFNSLEHDDVVGFRVHFNDDEVTSAMEQVAREHGVAYQHTKVFVKNGERVLKSPETWSEARYTAEINAAVN